MRIIFNIHSNKAAKAAGWRAMAVHVNDKNTADLEEALKAVTLADGSSMYDYIIEEDELSNEWSLFVNGISVSGSSCLRTEVKDN
ncbi:hypothetical protein OAC89_05925, partial [Deltaproteobacteria bacterium]|nr:hypothetical protein [Deltaproteobacteria bacterium]